MKKQNKKLFCILTVSFALFAAASLVYRNARYCWNDIPKMVIPDVLLSALSALAAVCLADNKKIIVRIIAGVAGFLFPNAILWGLSMPLADKLSDGGLGTTVGFIVFFAAYAVAAFLVFWIKDTGVRKAVSRITAVLSAAVMIVCAVISAAPLKITDTEDIYSECVKSVSIYENDFESALPQTEIYNMIKGHFNSGLPEGKTAKKCIVIGFDGTRADIIKEYSGHKKSAVKEIMSQNGHAVLSYCGGVQWPAENTQATSTAPGWCSMLTGCWADKTGITGNGIPKSLDCKSLFIELTEDKTVDSAKFCVSWDGHFVNENSTYLNEKIYAEENNLNVSFLDAFGDNGTFKNVIDDISSADCSDFLFCIFEECDHTGHQTNFGPGNFGYRDAFKNDDEFAWDIMEKIKDRETYDTEDWLIILTSDHGGYIDGHGGPSKQERYTFIISNKEI